MKCLLWFHDHKCRLSEMTAPIAGFGKNPEALKRYQLAEIKNGRLAMLGIGGMVHGSFIFPMLLYPCNVARDPPFSRRQVFER